MYTAFLLLGIAAAPLPGTPHPTGQARPASDCPALLGSSDPDFDFPGLEEVTASDTCIDIVHSTTWERPVPLRVHGLEVVRTREGKGGTRRAVVRVTPALARYCRPGLYAVGEGGSIGDMRVLAVLEHVVLVADGERLAYLHVPNTPAPHFRMTWASPWRLLRPAEVTARPGVRRGPRRQRR